ncbi:MAG: sigma 54-interacting transcriptional regulator [Vicinamibacteria bacterium]|jgi:transcriptional regulator with GAF, ATPase, and Fis domain|nr:sigma 54-interacting transcriptional regulator [Vicinamibacteria bacterium]
MNDSTTHAVHLAAVAGVSAAFGSLGRVFLCADKSFRVVHASSHLDRLIGPGASDQASGQTLSELLGADLFGPAGTLRQLLLAGERREGWRSMLTVGDERPRLVSLTAAPFQSDPGMVCDPRVAYIVVLRPAEEDQTASGVTALFPGLIGRSSAMERILRLVENLEHSEATVLLTGESGTGKEILARTIHAHSPRRNGPFVAVNCGALPGDLLESELFGHVRGAFTGAVRERAGRFELAAGGTMFLDEVGDVPLHLQVKLLRVLQEKTFEPVGQSKSKSTDARIIAATNLDLRRAVQEGRFREDLFYRLRVVPIEIPPLRERRADIEPLATHLLARVAARQGRALRFSPEALRAILDNHWPGNVRELENALEYAVAVSRGQTLLLEDLPAELQPSTLETPKEITSAPAAGPIHDIVHIRRALEAHRWRRVDAARALGISRATLWRRMREAGLSTP